VSDAKEKSTSGSGDYRIPESSPLAGAWKKAAAMGAVGVALAGVGFVSNPERFAFSYLTAFATVMTMWLGCVFFVLIQHLTAAGWSVTVRRSAEFFVAGIGVLVLPLLFLPNLASLDTLYPWWGHHESGVAHAQEAHEGAHAAEHGNDVGAAHAHEPGAAPEHAGAAHGGAHGAAAAHGGHHDPEHQAHETILSKKRAFLNTGFFFLRMVIYFGIWILLATRLFRYSTAQDANGDPQWTVKLQRFAPVGTILFALSLTFAGFDWFMSLEPNWFSTMFGVRVFASSAVLGLALVIITTLSFKRAGIVKDEINVEHFHDLGKLMFGFLVFWAYISFSEFMLIWYAAIPEETIYYHHRWDTGGWRAISISLVAIKFIIPFFFIMSRNIKRRIYLLGRAAGWLFALHLVEMYYWVMPYYFERAHGGELVTSGMGLLTDAGCFMMCIGIYLAVVLKRMLDYPVIPVKDPRLERALQFVNA
jgi:hypothetical protein